MKYGLQHQLPARILVVDDERDMRQLLALRLMGDGHEVLELDSGCELLRSLRTGGRKADDCCDVLVMDVRMPHLSGIETLTALRADGFLRPVILMSGFYDTATGAQASALGAPILSKPFT